MKNKTCSKCGKKLPHEDFYKYNNGTCHSKCKHCENQERKERYQELSQKKQGVRFHPQLNRLVVHNGYSVRIYWTGDMISILRRYFPNTKTEEVAEMIGVSPRTVIRKARELGLRKDLEFVQQVWNENRMLAQASNKIHGIKNTFQKGHIPWNKGRKLKAS